MRERQIPCPSNNEGCKYADTARGCHESIHHEYPRRTADTRLKRQFGELAIHKVLACRKIHDLLDTFPTPNYPQPDEMKRIIDREQRG